jgi:hypothetical protein
MCIMSEPEPPPSTAAAARRWVAVVGLCDPDAPSILIECACGVVSDAPRFAAAAKLHDEHVCNVAESSS